MTQTQPQPGGGGISINFPSVDWSKLIPDLVSLFLNAVGDFLNKMIHNAFDSLWGSGANVIGQTDVSMTWGFGPIQDQITSIQLAARTILIFALILLGLRGILSGFFPRQPEMLFEFINGVLAAIIMLAAFPLLIPELININNQAATAVGRADLSQYMSSGWGVDPILTVVLFVILLFFAIRLLIKAVWRIGFLAVTLPVGIFACATYAIPQLRWMLGWWVRFWGGLLFAQIPSVLALTIGVQLAAHKSGLIGFVYSIAFLQLATDLYNLFGRDAIGEIPGYGTPFGGVPTMLWSRMTHSNPATMAPAAMATMVGNGLSGQGSPQTYGY